MTLINSTLSNNSGGVGGGILNFNSGTVTVTNSTLSNNSSIAGGGITNGNEGIVTVTNSTLSGNSASLWGGGIFNNHTGTVTVNNSIVSGNSAEKSGDECELVSTGTFNANANNIFGTNNDNGGCPNGASDIVPVGAIGSILDVLADNGGPTQTHALVLNSPAIDASGAGATSADQRGVPAQSTRDIGAFEYGATPIYPKVEFSSAGTTYNETDGTVNIGLTISGAVDFAGIVEVYVEDALTGSATSGVDYTAFPLTTVSIDCSSGTCPTSKTVAFTLLTDTILENDEIANLALVGTNGFATIGTQSTFAATIQDTTTTITANDATATEDPVDNGQFTVDLGGVNDTGSAITVNYSISGTATNGADYTTLTGSVDVADGQQTATIDVIPLDDTTVESDETVELTLTYTNNASVSVDTTPAVVTIAPGADLTVTKTNSVGGATKTNTSWTWTLMVNNSGTGNPNFPSANDVILSDELPVGPTYSNVQITSQTNISGTTVCDLTTNAGFLTCFASGGGVSIGGTTGSFTVTVDAVSTVAGTFDNPSTGTCSVDPNNFFVETDETNNNCNDTAGVADTVVVSRSGSIDIQVINRNFRRGRTQIRPYTQPFRIPERFLNIYSSSATSASANSTSNTTTDSNGAVWEITITANPPFALPGSVVTFTITIRKLSGGTPVTMEFPLSDNFSIQSVSSNRGSVSYSGQVVTYSDDIHVGDTPVITVSTILDPNLSSPFTLTEQSCIVSPAHLCVSTTLASVTQLPSTGETPNWRNPLLLLLALSSLLILTGSGTVIWRQMR